MNDYPPPVPRAFTPSPSYAPCLYIDRLQAIVRANYAPQQRAQGRQFQDRRGAWRAGMSRDSFSGSSCITRGGILALFRTEGRLESPSSEPIVIGPDLSVALRSRVPPSSNSTRAIPPVEVYSKRTSPPSAIKVALHAVAELKKVLVALRYVVIVLLPAVAESQKTVPPPAVSPSSLMI